MSYFSDMLDDLISQDIAKIKVGLHSLKIWNIQNK